MVTSIVIKKKKRAVKSNKIETSSVLKICCLCSKQLSMYNKNKYELCHTCLTKVQQSVNDIPDSKFAEVLLQLRSDINNRSKSNKKPNPIKSNVKVKENENVVDAI